MTCGWQHNAMLNHIVHLTQDSLRVDHVLYNIDIHLFIYQNLLYVYLACVLSVKHNHTISAYGSLQVWRLHIS